MHPADFLLYGCWGYCALVVVAAIHYLIRRRAPTLADAAAGISILKPLSGLDEGLEDNLRTFFEQDYPEFELLFAVRNMSDPAAGVAESLMAEYPNVSARLLITGEPPYPHAKVFSLECMFAEARHGLIAMSDSDVRVGPDFCTRLASEFQDQSIGLVTCLYRAVSGNGFWSRLEAIGMNTEFHGGVLTAALMEGVKFAVGPTIVARRSVLVALGGLACVKDYIAEDFMLGKLASDLGVGVGFSSYVVEHRIGSESMLKNFSHRLRWARTARRSRPLGYLGQFFMHPLPISALACILCSAWWPLLLLTLVFRGLAAWTVGQGILRSSISWLLLPVQDFVSFGFWIAGFFGNSIHWRGRRYLLNRDGTVQLAP